MRPSHYCPKFLPWIGTDHGEIDRPTDTQPTDPTEDGKQKAE